MPRHADIETRSLTPFLLLSFGLTWGILGLWLTIPKQLAAMFGPLGLSNPLFLLAVYAPAIAAIAVIVQSAGLRGLLRYLSRLLLWRCPATWIVFLLVGIPANFYLGAWLKHGQLDLALPFASIEAALPVIGLMMMLGPVEELGWRGLALPLLQRKLSPLRASLVMGGIWALWHLPAFFLSGIPQSTWSVTAFSIGSVAVCVMMTPFFNACSGSILLSAAFHFQLVNPLFPDGQPHDTVFFVLCAALITVFDRSFGLSKGRVVTEVIPQQMPARGVEASARQAKSPAE